MKWARRHHLAMLVALPLAGVAAWACYQDTRLFVAATLNGVTLAALYFLVASGFALIFGLMRNVNLAHGSLYLLGAYLGYSVGDLTGSWYLGVAAGALGAAVLGIVLQITVFQFMPGQELRQALVTVAISVVLADLMMWVWGADIYQLDPPDWMFGASVLPIVQHYPTYRLILLALAIAVGGGLWFLLNRTRIGTMIRAGVDDRMMLAATGVNIQFVFAVTFAIGAGLAGFAGVIGGSALSISPGEDTRYLLASLIVVVVGGLGSVAGTAVGALLIGLSEQYGLAYAPTYGVLFTFVIMVVTLFYRPQGIFGGR